MRHFGVHLLFKAASPTAATSVSYSESQASLACGEACPSLPGQTLPLVAGRRSCGVRMMDELAAKLITNS